VSGPALGSPDRNGPHLPRIAYAAALAGLPGIGPVGLAGLLDRHDPATAWALVLAGEERRPESRERGARASGRLPWAVAARRVDVARSWSALTLAGIGVTCLGQPDYPFVLRDDPERPGVLFWRGDMGALDRRCVAIVGTRRCTHNGLEVAFEMGRDLAQVGVCVVSGLALGIDGAAHAGALASSDGAGPVGIAASGVDVPYPRRHTALWSRVIAGGAILSETPPGQPAQSWRFPARNRIIAALAGAVVVVESRAGGGSMLTVTAALARGVDVLAVPGPVHSPASAGTNQLLVDGSVPVRHAGDVLDRMGDVRPWPPPGRLAVTRRADSASSAAGRPAGSAGAGPSRSGLDPESQSVLAAVDWTPTPSGVIAERTGLAIGPLSAALNRLDGLALVRDDSGWWIRTRGDG
jgi:DNA processing protein